MEVESLPAVENALAPHKAVKHTYGRKPDSAPVEPPIEQESGSSLSSVPSSPAPPLFDKPMRRYGKAARHSGNGLSDHDQEFDDDDDEADDTACNTDVSPEQRELAKFGGSPRKRSLHRVDSNGSASSSSGPHQLDFSIIGAARRIMEEDSDEEDASGARARSGADSDHNENDDDEAAIAKVRSSTPPTAAAEQVQPRSESSDPFEGSLSSAPALSPQSATLRNEAESGRQRLPSSSNESSQMPVRVSKRTVIERDSESGGQPGSDDRSETVGDRTVRLPQLSSDNETANLGGSSKLVGDEDDPVRAGAWQLSRRRGAKVSAMKGKAGKQAQLASSDSEDVEVVPRRKAKTFQLASSSSVEEGGPAEASSSTVRLAKSRKEKMEALAAAKRRDTFGNAELADEEDAADVPSHEGERSRSRSWSIENDDDDDDDLSDGTRQFLQQSKIRSARGKELNLAQEAQDLQADLEGEGPLQPRKRRSKPSKSGKKAPKMTGPKPLSKKEIETMHRETARMERENRTRLAPVEKKQIRLSDLLATINAGEQSKAARSGSAGPAPSRQEDKSHHTSDPIESDPIRERSSPASSPINGLGAGQNQRRLGPSYPRGGQGLDALELKTVSQAQGSRPDADQQIRPEKTGSADRDQGDVATNKDDDDDDDDDDGDDNGNLPAPESFFSRLASDKARKDQFEALRKRKLKALEALEAAKRNGGTAGPSHDRTDAVNQLSGGDDDDGFEIDGINAGITSSKQPGQPQAQHPASSSRMPPVTPGRKRPSDAILRDVGIKPARTPARRKAGTDAFGSPGMALGSSPNGAHDEDEDFVTDSQLREAGKAFAAASDKAAGKTPIHVRNSDVDQAGRSSRPRAPPTLTKEQFNATLMRKAFTQNIQVRQKKEAQARKLGHSNAANTFGTNDADEGQPGEDLQAMIDRLRHASQSAGEGDDAAADDEVEDEDDADFIMPAADDVEDAIGSGSEIGGDRPLGSGSEVEDDGENEEVESAAASDDEEQVEEDSEKENAPPRAAQVSFSSPASSQRNVQPSRAVMDEDEDDAPGPRATSRRRRRTAFAAADDDDDNEGGDAHDENRLQPGRTVAAGSPGQGASKPNSQERIVLGDISAESLGTPSQAVEGREPYAAQELEGDESFNTDNVSVGGFTQLFAPTQAAGPTTASEPARRVSQRPVDFWDMSQTQQTQSQATLPHPTPSRAAEGLGHGTTMGTGPGLNRDDSVNSALGAFFEDTQSQMASESMDIFANKKSKDGMAKGFTQFFGGTPGAPASTSADGTEDQPTSTPGAFADSQSQSQWDADRFSMPPPRSTAGLDGFAALRKAQMGEAMGLTPTPSLLPSLDESQAEREAEAAGRRADANRADASSPPKKMYLNQAGFFTQTKPSTQQAAEWGLDSQSQSQSQSQLRTPFKVGSGSLEGRTPASPTTQGDGLDFVGAADGSDDEHDDGAAGTNSPTPKPRQLKRLKRGVSFQDDHVPSRRSRERSGSDGGEEGSGDDRGEATDGAEDAEDDDDEDGGVVDVVRPPAGQARNAFDVLRSGAAHAGLDPVASDRKGKSRRSEFVQGEAEESEDEELGGRGDKSGLGRVFSDDERGSGDEDEDDDDEDDGGYLEELVDDERDDDEAEKDGLARERLQRDLAAQDDAALAYHQKAVRGEFRNRRKGRDGSGLEGFLDEDADEEELKRRVAQPRGGWFKKRKVDGERDEMDELRDNEEARAFVQAYEVSHRANEADEYDFLAPKEGDADSGSGSDDDDDGSDSGSGSEQNDDGERRVDRRGARDGHDDPDAVDHEAIVTRSDLVRELRERRRQKRRGGYISDDDDDGDAIAANERRSAEMREAKRKKRLEDPDYESDEDEAESRIALALRDRLKEQKAREEVEAERVKARARRQAKVTLGGAGADGGGTGAGGRKPRTLGTTSRLVYGKMRERNGSGKDVLQRKGSTGETDSDPTRAEENGHRAGGTVDITNDHILDDEDDDDEGPTTTDMHLHLERRAPPSASRALPSGTTGDEETEPEWSNDASLYRMSATKPAGHTSSSASSAAAVSASRTASGGWKRKPAAEETTADAKRRREEGARRSASGSSLLLGRKVLMSREAQFSESL